MITRANTNAAPAISPQVNHNGREAKTLYSAAYLASREGRMLHQSNIRCQVHLKQEVLGSPWSMPIPQDKSGKKPSILHSIGARNTIVRSAPVTGDARELKKTYSARIGELHLGSGVPPSSSSMFLVRGACLLPYRPAVVSRYQPRFECARSASVAHRAPGTAAVTWDPTASPPGMRARSTVFRTRAGARSIAADLTQDAFVRRMTCMPSGNDDNSRMAEGAGAGRRPRSACLPKLPSLAIVLHSSLSDARTKDTLRAITAAFREHRKASSRPMGPDRSSPS